MSGTLISTDGIKPDPDKVAVIMDMLAPANVSEVRCVLGVLNQLAKFLPPLAELSAPIQEMLRMDRAWIWSAAQEETFSKIKTSICSTPTLAHYDPSRPTLL